MNMRATLIAVIIAAVVAWLLAGLFHMVLIKDMEHEAFSAFQSVMHTPENMPSPVLWIIPLLLLHWLYLFVATRGGAIVTMASCAKVSILVTVIITLVSAFDHFMTFASYNMNLSLIYLGWDVVQTGVSGGVMGLIYSKLNKH